MEESSPPEQPPSYGQAPSDRTGEEPGTPGWQVPPPPPPPQQGRESNQGGQWPVPPPPPPPQYRGWPQGAQGPYGGGGWAPGSEPGRGYAEWWKRVVADIIDGLIIGVPVYILLFAVIGVGSNITTTSTGQVTVSSGTANEIRLFGLIATVIVFVYYGLLDGSQSGQTLGKRIMHIATRDANTAGPIGFGRALLRRFIFALLWYLFLIPGLINSLSPLWDARSQAWHDKVASSVVLDAP